MADKAVRTCSLRYKAGEGRQVEAKVLPLVILTYLEFDKPIK